MPLLHNRISGEELKQRLMEETEPRTTISFYKYFPIQNPQEFRDHLYKHLYNLRVFGRIYVAKEGINAQASVPQSNYEALKTFLHSIEPLNGIRLNVAVDDDGKSFWVLRVKVRDKIVADGINDLSFNMESRIINYAREIKEKSLESKFIGKNFVFDERLGERITEDIISHCHQCGKPCDTHTNCKNDGCHLLFIQCDDCAKKYNGCC